ncbi:hypothetical protein [Castellaniella defragrans]|jgi:hypothetical protein|uniref:Uncharacterized protein n=2 Tax=Castellaniella defragrans TaxID=75697 RepID=W8X142_CASD6|nr:hypothetical protein [Castellaniella defragrans]MBB6082059.1 hypothetical protein [Castellaniella defragrans]CDM23002.1 hypothetical protein BN940_02631 [Castellaniella defragrans 65Phen]
MAFQGAGPAGLAGRLVYNAGFGPHFSALFSAIGPAFPVDA